VGGVCDLGYCPEHPGDHLVHTALVCQHVIVGEAENVDASTAHILVASSVAFGAHMRLAIDLDDEFGMHAGEVGVVGPDRLLPAKVPTIFTKLPEQAPQGALRTGLVVAKGFGPGDAQRDPLGGEVTGARKSS